MQSEEIIVADSSPLIGLARIGQLDLLRKLARCVVVPELVWSEVTKARRTAPGAEEVLAQGWIDVRSPNETRVAELSAFVDRGEAEALALGEELSGSLLLIDDRRGRQLAEQLGLRRIGTLGLLAVAKRAGLVDRVRPLVDSLLANNIYIRPEIIKAVLSEVGEL